MLLIIRFYTTIMRVVSLKRGFSLAYRSYNFYTTSTSTHRVLGIVLRHAKLCPPLEAFQPNATFLRGLYTALLSKDNRSMWQRPFAYCSRFSLCVAIFCYHVSCIVKFNMFSFQLFAASTRTSCEVKYDFNAFANYNFFYKKDQTHTLTHVTFEELWLLKLIIWYLVLVLRNFMLKHDFVKTVEKVKTVTLLLQNDLGDYPRAWRMFAWLLNETHCL